MKRNTAAIALVATCMAFADARAVVGNNHSDANLVPIELAMNGGEFDHSEATVMLATSSVSLSLPGIFGSGMVLQRELPIHIWGQGPVGETVSVNLSSGQTAEVVVDAESKWAVSLASMAATNGPLTLTVSTPGSSITLTNLAVGEVWLCSGQSNMANTFNVSNGPRIDSSVFDMDLSGFRFDSINNGWQTLTYDSQDNLSEVAFYFALELYKELDVPIGLIQRYHKGTPIQAWMPVAASEVIRKELNIPSDWNDVDSARNPGVQFAEKIDPIIPISFRGTIWYQGERNSKTYTGWEYRHLLPFHIKTWRELWAARSGTEVRNFPFYYVQVPTQSTVAEEEWPWLRDGMRRTLDLTENTGMAIFYDYGPSLHPANKKPAGQRLALWALAKDYGYANLAYCGPLLDKVEFTGTQAILSFTHIGGGLASKTGAAQLDFFEVAGADGVYGAAEAWIDGDTVIVQRAGVTPAYVRYLFKKPIPSPAVSLINAEGIPASSFMTDNFMPSRTGRPMPPLAIADHYVGETSQSIIVPAPGILDNDSPGTNGTLEAQLVNGVSHGSLEFNGNGSFVYAPSNGFSGHDAFDYIAVNGASHSLTTTVSLVTGAIEETTGITHGGTTINMGFVDIGHAGNAADGTYGVVGYDYRIGTFEVKASQWATVLAADPNIGNAGSWSNSLPTASASWYEASKFANWLTTGNAYDGAYQYNSGGTLTNVLTRAQMIDLGTIFYVLPTEDEWYKAAYFKSDGSGYTSYATGDAPPLVGSGGENYSTPDGSVWDVGSGSASSIENNGTFDMNGNVWEWTESAYDGTLDNLAENRSIRGGAFGGDESYLVKTKRTSRVIANQWDKLGFRVVEIPPFGGAIPHYPLAVGTVIGVDFGQTAPNNAAGNIFNGAAVPVGATSGSIAAGSVVDMDNAVVDGVSFEWSGGQYNGNTAADSTDLPGQPAIYNDSNLTDYLLTKQGNTITLTFSGLDDSLTYNLNIGGGFTQSSNDADTLYAADGQSFTNKHDDGALAWGNLNGLSTDGSSSLVITVNDAAGKTDKFATVSALTLTAVSGSDSFFSAWANGYSIAGMAGYSDDPDGDGLDNLAEYGFGGAPDDFNDAPAPVFENMKYIYRRRTDAVDRGLSYVLEECTDLVLGDWNASINSPTGYAQLGSGIEAVTNQISSTETNHFIRLHISIDD